MNNFCINIFILIISFFSFSYQVLAAEVLQVSTSSVLLVGDNNRTYTVKLACADIIPESEDIAIKWLKKQLPRHTKVNLKPKGFVDGVLLARVIPFNSDIDITQKYINEGLAEEKC